jgi:hypothetical protein
MIKWEKYEQNLNIKEIEKVIDILPCGWADGYIDYDENNNIILTPQADGKNLIYAISDSSDGYVIAYYKCSADGTILEIGEDDEEDW